MINVETPEAKLEESKRIGLMIAKRHLQRTIDELDFLVHNTTGEARDTATRAMTLAANCKLSLEGLKL